MTLFEQWNKRLSSDRVTKEEWDEYLAKELNFYKDLLSEYGGELDEDATLKTKRSISGLMEDYKLMNLEAVGLFDGINESLVEPLTLDSCDETSEVEFHVDFKKLYLNMLKVKATWLSSLPEWDKVLSHNARREIRDEYVASITAKSNKEAGRNDPCPCGSGKKYKKCCGIGK
ncbi:MAG: SEC-C metal-binding domain-containing protein [Bacillota bacterium]|nr:SEC-C metal-binding domain-containing protein [Bacillota bacterium]